MIRGKIIYNYLYLHIKELHFSCHVISLMTRNCEFFYMSASSKQGIAHFFMRDDCFASYLTVFTFFHKHICQFGINEKTFCDGVV